MKKKRQYSRQHRPETTSPESSVLESTGVHTMAPPPFAPVQLAAAPTHAPIQRQTPAAGESEERTVETFIDIIRRLEAAYPDAPPEEIAGRLAMTSQYNGERFQEMMGIEESGYQPFTPVDGQITQEDLDALTSMMDHSGDREATEEGIALGGDGNYTALGHVVTGLVSGMNENPEFNPVAEGLGGGMGGATASAMMGNPTFNNVMGMTLAGDLGQSGAMTQEEIVNTTPPRLTSRGHRPDRQAMNAATNSATYVGDGTEATAAEMRGDVDGINMAERWQGSDPDERPSVSSLFSDYYGEMGDDPGARYDEFERNVGREFLTEQSINFAENYNLRKAPGDLNRDVNPVPATRLAVDQFYEFVEEDRHRQEPEPVDPRQTGPQ